MNTLHPDLIEFYIQTRKKIRKITAYRSDDCPLRIRHDKIKNFLEEFFVPSAFTKAYVKGRSIYHNAQWHMYNDYFIMLDIKDFFPSICHNQLADKIYREMNLSGDNRISRKECKNLVSLCSISNRGLPLGFVTSPILSNIYLKEFDCIFYGKLKQLGLKNVVYTRYADDLTISFQSDSRNKVEPCFASVEEIAAALLKRYGLHLNKQKSRAYNLNISNHVKITGVNITKDANNFRHLTVGRATKNQFFWDTVNNLGRYTEQQIDHIKGMHAFILSIEKTGYESCYSEHMLQKVKELGFETLSSLIDSL